MQINIKAANRDWQFKLANRYLPVRLSTTYFDVYGDCIVLVANRADGITTAITENEHSEVFVTIMDHSLYEELRLKVLNMDFWLLPNHYNTYNGLADGISRKIHLDGMVF